MYEFEIIDDGWNDNLAQTGWCDDKCVVDDEVIRYW